MAISVMYLNFPYGEAFLYAVGYPERLYKLSLADGMMFCKDGGCKLCSDKFGEIRLNYEGDQIEWTISFSVQAA